MFEISVCTCISHLLIFQQGCQFKKCIPCDQNVIQFSVSIYLIKVKKAKTRNRYNQVSQLIRYTILESKKKKQENATHTRAKAAGGHKAAGHRQDSVTKTNMKHKYAKKDPQKKHHPGKCVL